MKKLTRTDLGLAVLSASPLFRGIPLQDSVQAAACDCTRQFISLIYQKALRKIRRQLTIEEWETLSDIFIRDRQPAKRHR